MKNLGKLKSLALLICLTLFLVGCSDPTDSKDNSGATVAGGGADVGASAAEGTGETAELAEIPAKDMDGKEIKILTNGWWSYSPLNFIDIAPESATGEILNDAAYNRKVKIEEQYNCKIIQIDDPDYTNAASTLQKSVSAQDNAYDIAFVRGTSFSSLLTDGSLLNLDSLPYVDFDNSWWKKNAYDALGIGGKHFGVCGDISTNEMMTVWITCFNKNMIKDYGIGSPYELVKSGDWTFDKAIEMGKSIAKDLNGDGSMGIDDLWGINYTNANIMGLLNGSGVTIAQLDSTGVPQITLDSESNISKIQNIYSKLLNKAYSVNTFTLDLYDFDGKIFAEEKCLLLFTATHLVGALRQMDTDFGIVPYPKYDAAQSEYLPSTAGIFLSIVCVPNSNTDIENTGLFLEAFASEGSKTIVPAFYENILMGKMTRDDESVDMLKYIFTNISYDTGNLFNFAGISDSLCSQDDINVVSFLEQQRPVIDSAISKILDEVNK